MQVVILCGGLGTRIREVTEDLPKPMIPVGGKPILWHIMRHYAHFGFHDFVLCLGYKSWSVKNFFLNYHLAQADLQIDLAWPKDVRLLQHPETDNWQITLAETGLNTMTAGRIKRVEKYINSDHFFLTYGDGLADVDLHALLAHHLAMGKCGTVTAVPPPSRFGEIELNQHQVYEFNEKPLAPRGRINGGFFVFRRDFFDRLPEDDSLIFEREPLQHLARDGELAAYAHDGFWHCMDNGRDYHDLNAMWDGGKPAWVPAEKVSRRLAA